MLRNTVLLLLGLVVGLSSFSCTSQKESKMKFTGAKGEVKLMILDPGHFHAQLVLEKMYNQVSPVVNVYAPEGPEVEDYVKAINNFNTRSENPTSWQLKVYKGPDFLKKMIEQKPGNVMVTAGNNRKKTEYLKATVDASINVLSDKPMCINKQGFELLKETFASAKKNHVLLYDIMTERYSITTVLQKALSEIPDVFGELQKGTLENPAVTKESVHHFFKYVSGRPLKRPPWYFDVTQEGEGLVDVTSHLVDLVQWECFPGQALNYQTDIQMLSAKHWPTMITKAQFAKVTQLPDFPDYLKAKLNDKGVLPVFSNGEMDYTVKGVHAKVSVVWKYEAEKLTGGTGDTHFSIIRGTKANIIIRQGKEQGFIPELYVTAAKGANAKALASALQTAIKNLQTKYPGLELEKQGKKWHVIIPDKYRLGHEAHFAQVMQKYLKFLVDGKLPDWEVPNMIAKYYTTTSALEMALQK
ncbi:MAG: oxidoreductase [Calditrichaeota bacterium]|nr:oxidoreductase [Calditrichota bacterium]